MTDQETIEALRAENEGLKRVIEDNAKLVLHIRMEGEKLRADVEDTKALLPNKHEADVPLRPTEHHDWWCVSIMERRKRIAAENEYENEKLRAAVLDLRGQVEAEQEQARKDAFYVADLLHEIEKLRAAMHDIYEVYAGSEGFIPQTCPEAYLQERVKEMAYIAAKHKRAAAAALKETGE